MRNNQPVTQTERHLQENEYIVSKTDLKGRITYVNRPFLDISGFSEDELLGTAHNIVRHPDMPPEAYEDLWRHLKAGQSWQGMVKNRCKNGDYYWVQANANPIWENGQMTGFMSLRVRPTREQVREAETFYASLRSGRARGWTVRHGAAARTGLRGRISELQRTLRHQAVPILGTLAVLNALVLLGLGIREQAGMQTLLSLGPGLQVATASSGLLLLLSALVWATRTQLMRPLADLQKDMQSVSAGILILHQVSSDTVGANRLRQTLDTMRGNLSSMVQDIRAAAAQITSGSRDTASASQSLSQAASEQAAAVEQTTATLEQAGASIQQNAENARQTNSIAQSAANQAAEGGQAVSQTMDAMRSIAERISVIDDIAYQTNMLALNAAIEAARAGEHGKGFAVVAAEVRKLAEKSQNAAKEIGDLALSTTRQADHAGGLLQQIVPAIGKTSDLVQEISAASEEQATGIQQITQAVSQLNTVTQQNASASEQLAATSEELSSQADFLEKAMAQFRLTGEASTVVMTRAERKRHQATSFPDQHSAQPEGGFARF